MPLYDSAGCRAELIFHLGPGWDPVVDKDIDSDHAETAELETREPRFGTVNAARRVARTLFLGSAPSSVVLKSGVRGLDRAHILLGCVQPGQAGSVYSDALNRLADRLNYLNASGDKAQDSTRFWFDTLANLRREMENRKQRFDDKNEVRGKLGDVLKKLTGGAAFFDGVHIFTPHADVPDDSALRLIMLPPEHFYSREETRLAFDAALDTVRNHGTMPRYRGNRLVFLAPDYGALARMRDSIRVALAWASIVKDVNEGRLNIDLLQKKQAETELTGAENLLPRVARECYKWLLCPGQTTATNPKPIIEVFPLNTGGASLGNEIERVCLDNELVITTWSPIHLRTRMQELYWKPDKPAFGAMAFWEDTMRYLYLPRLKSRSVLEQAIVKGAGSRDFFATAYGQHERKFDGFKFGDTNVQLDDTLLLIEPEAAKAYEAAHPPGTSPGSTITGPLTAGTTQTGLVAAEPASPGYKTPGPTPKPSVFHGNVAISALTAKMRMVQVAEEIIAVLAADPNAEVKVIVKIQVNFPSGASDQTKRAVTENARTLNFKNADWE